MVKYYFIIIWSVLWYANSYSQVNPKIHAKAFFTESNGMEKARKELKAAEKYYKKGHGTYDEALKHYLKVYDYNPNSPELNYKIGVCYLWTSDKKASLKYFLESSPDVSGFYYLGLGRAYQYNLMFDKAKESYERFYSTIHNVKKKDAKALVDQLKRECEVSASIVKDSLPVFIINLGPVLNSYYDDYGAIISADRSKLFFTSKRPAKEPQKRVSRFKFKERVFYADNNAVDSSANQVFVDKKLNGGTNTSVAGFSNETNRIYFYKGLIQNGRIMTALWNGTKWNDIKKLKKINHIAYRETSIAFDNDGTAYFVTTRRGGYGGKDIWMAKHKKNRKYYKPVNLGNKINTPFDEEGVYVTPDGNTLFFSSKGHKGMGGFDVYKSVRDKNGEWDEPVNLGYPINSPADELFYRPTQDTMVALYATIRSDSYGGLDIYKIKKDPRIPFAVKGVVRDANTGKIIPATIDVYDLTSQKVLRSTVVDTVSNMYKLDFEDKGKYLVQVDYKGYKSVSREIECPAKRHSEIQMEFDLELLKHPFTLTGTVTDKNSGTPLRAGLTFHYALYPDSVAGRTVSNDSTGNYIITFNDKFDMLLHAEADDYFSLDTVLNLKNKEGDLIMNNIKLKRSKIDYVLAGMITSLENEKPLKASVKLYLPGENEPFAETVSDSLTGKYSLTVSLPGPFMTEVLTKGYFYVYNVFSFPWKETVVAKNFRLKKMNTGVKLVLKNILFNTGKATLKHSSFETLNKLADLLLKNPDVRVEVSGHTDNVGSASYNKKLSKQRALAVKNYLVSRGVEQDRIVATGYGFEQPIAPNDTPEGRAQNRRVEMKILN